MKTLAAALLLLASLAHATTSYVDLGSAGHFSVLAGSAVTNTGSTVLDGDLGLWPGTSITGFPPGIVNGTIHNDDAVAMQAESDLNSAYLFAAAQPCDVNLTGHDLGGLTLTPGTYCFSSSAQLTGTLTLNAEGNPNAVFLFQMGSTLTTASNSSVVFTNDGSGAGVFWRVGSSATLGTTTDFQGSILAETSITLNTGADIGCGRALAINGAVTLDTNFVDASGCEVVGTPEPGTIHLFGLGIIYMTTVVKRNHEGRD